MLTLFRAIARFPLAWLHACGTLLGWTLYLASPRYRQRLRENLALAGLDTRQLRHAAIAEAGKGMSELPAVWLRPYPETLAMIREKSGYEHIEAARSAGSGILFLTPHFGCFEIASLFCASLAPLAVLYRQPKLGWLEPLLRTGRERGQARLATADLSGVRALLKALRRGESCFLLPDQVPGNGDGVWAPFFGHPAWTMTLAARLQQSTGASILFILCERLPHGRGYRLRIEPPDAPLPAEPHAAAAAINAEMERLIRLCPQQYLWSYNRYKVPAGVTPPC